jgi:hypothetical protein
MRQMIPAFDFPTAARNIMSHHFAGGPCVAHGKGRMEHRLRTLAPSSGQPPDDVHVELVDGLFTALAPILFMGLATVVVSALAAARHHDSVSAGLAGAGLLVTLVRAVTIQTYRRRRGSVKLLASDAPPAASCSPFC